MSVAAVAGVLLLDPISQALAYHEFADRRTFAGTPNLFDVISRRPFLVIGLTGWSC